jgi:hypothetical protein
MALAKVIQAIKVSAGAKSPPLARKPITIGIIIDDATKKLKVPPAIPISLFGASNEKDIKS